MFRLIVVSLATLVALSGLAVRDAAARQNITGQVVSTGDGAPLTRIQVDLLDALNAGVVATAVSDPTGYFDSGDLPAGSYRIRFSDPFGQGTRGSAIPEMYGAGADEFCAGSPVTLASGATFTLRQELTLRGPVLVTVDFGGLSGNVWDAVTRAPVQGVQVSLLRADNGEVVPITRGTAVTDAAGYYSFGFELRGTSVVKVRFSDPRGAYFPEFAGTTDLARDDFCTASRITDWRTPLDALLNRVPPEQSTQSLLNLIENLTVPDQLKTALGTPLLRAVDLMTDGNGQNDGGACAQLSAFVTRVDIKERTGQLAPGDANLLRQMATNTRYSLNCSTP